MLNYVTLTIDGATTRAPEGITVLDAALEAGICIPHLCHVRNITPIGACRLCIVELIEGKKTKITASCTLDVREGLVIRTNTERIRRLRHNLAELLVAQAPNSRAVQDMAVRCGVRVARYPFRNEACIQCGRCVRICSNVWKANAIGFVGRGKERRVGFPFGNRPDSCHHINGCSYCVDVCPMTVTPCGGVMKPGQERLCGQCESQLSMERDMPGLCIQCDLGKGFKCLRREA